MNIAKIKIVDKLLSPGGTTMSFNGESRAMSFIYGLRWGYGFFVFLIPSILEAAEESFQTDIQPIKSLVKRDKDSLIALDKIGESLLNNYQQPHQRGEIYYYLAHQHTQGGLVFPQRVIDYAGKALRLPVTPDQKMRLYVYRGDALHVLNRKKPFAERRREAVSSYLQGLKDLKSFQLPDLLPDVPNNAPKLVFNPGSIEKNREAQRNFEEERQRYLKARDRAEFTRTMMMHRKVLQGQIVAMYSRRPVATDELRRLASDALGESKEYHRLMEAVKDKVAKLPPETKPVMIPIQKEAPPMPSKYMYLAIALAAGGALILVLRWLSRRNRAKHAAGTK